MPNNLQTVQEQDCPRHREFCNFCPLAGDVACTNRRRYRDPACHNATPATSTNAQALAAQTAAFAAKVSDNATPP